MEFFPNTYRAYIAIALGFILTIVILKLILPKWLFDIIWRIMLVFALACVLQYVIPWYFLAGGGVVAGFFMLKTSDDRSTSLGMLIGSIAFGIFAYSMAQIFPVAG